MGCCLRVQRWHGREVTKICHGDDPSIKRDENIIEELLRIDAKANKRAHHA